MLACSVTSKMLVTEYVLRSKTEMTAASLQAVQRGHQGSRVDCRVGASWGPYLYNSGTHGRWFGRSAVQLHARAFTTTHNAPLPPLPLL